MEQISIFILFIVLALTAAFSGGFVGIPKQKPFDPSTVVSETTVVPTPPVANSSIQANSFKVEITYVPTAAGCGASDNGTLNMAFYIKNWNFQQPTNVPQIDTNTMSKLKKMVPFACIGAAAFDKKYNQQVTPQLIVWWSYIEGIFGNESFSNCQNTDYKLDNCFGPGSWQLGYGIQFTAVPTYLKEAFTDFHSGETVQSVGQKVLQVDGNPSIFPNYSIDQIVADISTSNEVPVNWWASVLSRDPAINSYINAAALTPAGLPWSGWMSCAAGYCKDRLSNGLAAILQAWPQLVQ